jgi:hypothetical protein
MPSEHNSSGSAPGLQSRNRREEEVDCQVAWGRNNTAVPMTTLGKGGKALVTNGEVRANACLPPLALGLH